MLKKISVTLFLLIFFLAGTYGVLVWKNNRAVSPPTRQEIIASWERSISWLTENRDAVLRDSNPILWWMIGESAKITGDTRLQTLYADFRKSNDANNALSVWQAFFAPEQYWGASYSRENFAIYADYQQYFLFGLTCSKQLATEPIIESQHNTNFCWRAHPFTPACTTHQLMGFRFLQRTGCDRVDGLDAKIAVLQNSIERQLTWDPRVVDVYVQRVLMLVDSGAANRVKPRWLERMLAAQLNDGSWSNLQPLVPIGGGHYIGFNERLLGVGRVQGNLHATAQGLLLLSLLQQRDSQFNMPPP
jgi:hypothetical protein